MSKVVTTLTPKEQKELRKKQLLEVAKNYPPRFVDYVDSGDYEEANVIPIEPMSAKEPLNIEAEDEMFNSSEYFTDIKKDGIRGTLHLREEGNRLFSRNVSKKTNWYKENTDSVPHLRDFKIPKTFLGTILDGEVTTPNDSFKDVSSIMNCIWDEAILRQQEDDLWVRLEVFDIIYYKGVYVAKMPLYKRKLLVAKVVKELNCPFIVEMNYFNETVDIKLKDDVVYDLMWRKTEELKEAYPNLYTKVKSEVDEKMLDEADIYGAELGVTLSLTKREYYEYVVLCGGEGLMMKHYMGTYRHTRGREYTKIKKFTTRECVILGFTPPTIYYDGKEKDNPEGVWHYWCDAEDDSMIVMKDLTMIEAQEDGLLPCTKFHALDYIGTVQYGVIITNKELEDWQKKNPKEKPQTTTYNGYQFLYVGETSGIDDETREYMTKNQTKLIGQVIELKCHEVLKTGKLRHPRFLRFREDKEMERCIYKDHMEGVK